MHQVLFEVNVPASGMRQTPPAERSPARTHPRLSSTKGRREEPVHLTSFYPEFATKWANLTVLSIGLGGAGTISSHPMVSTFENVIVVPDRLSARIATLPMEETVHHPYQDSVTRHLSKVPDIDAIYILSDDEGVVHVYSVVGEYSSSAYERLLKQERLVEKEFPQVAFEFHTCAHQGRKPFRAVPLGSKPVFVR